jgi:hypothetical protein
VSTQSNEHEFFLGLVSRAQVTSLHTYGDYRQSSGKPLKVLELESNEEFILLQNPLSESELWVLLIIS